MSFKQFFAQKTPQRFQLPLRYFYSLIRGKLEPELKVAEQYAKTRERFIDIGAHYGHWCYRLRRFFIKIEAFEPQFECAQIIRAARIQRLETHEVALSDCNNTGELHIPTNHSGHMARGLASLEPRRHSSGVHVQLRTLDSYDFQDVGLIKIDVEGHEDAVLRGAASTLKRCQPTLIVEIEIRHRKTSPSEAFNFLSNLGYEAFFLHPQFGLMSAKNFSWPEFQKQDQLPGDYYLNNFIFLPTHPPSEDS